MDEKLVPLCLQPASVPEWEAEDLVMGVLGSPVTMGNAEELKQLLEEVILSLPAAVFERRLQHYEDAKDQFGQPLEADTARFAFYMVQVPLNMLVPEGKHISRLRLTLNLKTDLDGKSGDDGNERAVAYDLFPPDRWDNRKVCSGKAKLDISKMLKFICPAVPDCLGLDLTLPIQWNTLSVKVRTTDRMSNPVVWDVSDESVEHGFTGSIIVRAPKLAKVTIEASLVCEICQTGLRGLLAGRFRSQKVQTYILK